MARVFSAQSPSTFQIGELRRFAQQVQAALRDL
jgi:hypothetical protein